MRPLALYLPQFHEVPENNEWWGHGFTEWTNVRSAVPLFDGHDQPAVPLGGRYYDLTDPDVLVWQSKIASEYGLGGFIFFHYWYEGKLLLEKPVELYGDTAQATTPFCLCWANHPWTRSWDGKEHDVLQAQTYGGEADWDAHIEYLLPFFKDDRYITQNGHPVLFLYNASAIPGVDAMVNHWNERLAEDGIPSIYVVEYISSKNPEPNCSLSSAVYEDEPVYSLRFQIPLLKKAKRYAIKKTDRIDLQDYDDIWKRILRKKRIYGGRDVIQGGFVGWDNSPRRGARGPMIVRKSSPESFEKYLRKLVGGIRENASKDFIVINAWNEWGEGAMLEPTERDGYSYLEAVRRVFAETK
ncbi:glycoside hydrolase family 99-like domain-containing protein [Nocardioides pantholopis]|uniref:glycosyltransferase WbsX family protein n=1 Tax=Nocardioides pantholopis TaxID=2483798 RepID=UPI000FD91F1E|nr:glycoside hydrolase family 99-like domain-containing protein [Nocardioides pantholopis]